jgi:o-succinylbenzoate synthase
VQQVIYGYKYQLIANSALNQKGKRTSIDGFLIRVNDGYGCVQPWTEFGHQPIDDQWKSIANRATTNLVNIAIKCAELDGAARRENRSLFHELKIPESHATITDLPSQADAAIEARFTTWKIKATTELIIPQSSNVELRLDFNGAGTYESLKKWIGNLTEQDRTRIEFIEDPFSYDENLWQKFIAETSIECAIDYALSSSLQHPFIPVWKPAWTEKPIHNNKQLIVTSAMDHPLGQAWAAYNAGLYAPKSLCGLRTDHLFEGDCFTQRMGIWNPQWPEIVGTGLGFDDLLEKLPWKQIR